MRPGRLRIDAVFGGSGAVVEFVAFGAVEAVSPPFCFGMLSMELLLVERPSESYSFNVRSRTSISVSPATMDFALALPTESVVLGSLLGGAGAFLADSLRGSVAHCR